MRITTNWDKDANWVTTVDRVGEANLYRITDVCLEIELLIWQTRVPRT